MPLGQELKEGGELVGGEGLGARGGLDFCGGERGGDFGGIPSGGAEVVGEVFAFLGEAMAEEDCEGAGLDAEVGIDGLEGPAEDGGMDLGRRGECGGGQGEELFDAAVELDGEGEQAVVAGAG